jgi:hypothetical protein
MSKHRLSLFNKRSHSLLLVIGGKECMEQAALEQQTLCQR